MRTERALNMATLKTGRLEQVKDTNGKPPIVVAKNIRAVEEGKEENKTVKPNSPLNKTVTEKRTRTLNIRSVVQGIRDDIYRDGERITSIEFLRVPADTFRRGRLRNFHRVTISKDFYLGKYLVTQAQWEAIMEDNPSHFRGAKWPVENVSWEDCQLFIEKLNYQTGRNIYRLPTEAEWEHACRAGSITAYSFGDDKKQLGEHAWFSGNSGDKTHPVGQKTSNPWGFYDMYGNVWEWCKDWYAPYPRGLATDPEGPSSGSDRVLRGGGWYDGVLRCRSGFRSYFSPDFRCSFFGLRLARKAV
jgi:formylglycine-generating enzyme required for sulfatase activity